MMAALATPVVAAALLAVASASGSGMEPTNDPMYDPMYDDPTYAGEMPTMNISEDIPLVEPPVWPHLHPSHQSLDNLVVWSDMVANAEVESYEGDLVSNLTKKYVHHVTEGSMDYKRHRRSSLATFENDLLQAFLKYSGIKQSNLYKCTTGLYDTAKDIYGLVQKHSWPSTSSILSVVKEGVKTILSCLQFAMEHSSFFGSVYNSVSGVLHDIINADTIMQDCGTVVSMIRSKSINWWNLGKAIATCYKDISRRARRDLANRDTPASWSCDATWYNDTRVCNMGCNMTDPDCLRDHDFSIVTKLDHIPSPHAPLNWVCAPTMFGSGDGCDLGCGETDPDCLDTSAPVHTWNAQTAFSVENSRMLNKIHLGASVSDACNAHFVDEDPEGCVPGNGPTNLEGSTNSGDGSGDDNSGSLVGVIVVSALLACALAVIAILTVRLKRAEKDPAKYLERTTTVNPYASKA